MHLHSLGSLFILVLGHGLMSRSTHRSPPCRNVDVKVSSSQSDRPITPVGLRWRPAPDRAHQLRPPTQVFEQDGDVLAEVAPGFGYRASASAPSASVRVLDVDQRFQIRALHSDGSPLTGGARLAHIRVDEGAGRLVLAECVTLYDREPRSRITLKFSLTTQAADPISAEYRNNQDYRSFAEQVACREEGDPLLGWTSTSGGDLGVPPSSTGFRRVQRDGGYIYQSVYTGVHDITDDQVYDPDEFFGVKIQRGPNLTKQSNADRD